MITICSMTETATDPILTKIRGLLDKADATDFAEEAEAFRAKAIALMAKYRVDAAMLDAARPQAQRREVVEVTVEVGSGHYVWSRMSLLTAVAGANDVRCLTSVGYNGRVAHLIGTSDDVAATEMLYTSLSLQAARDGADLKGATAAETRRMRRSFLNGFAHRITERLDEQADKAAADAETGETSVALVLADKSQMVDDWIGRRYGRVGSARGGTSAHHPGGYGQGRDAGSRADLGTGSVDAGTRGALRA